MKLFVVDDSLMTRKVIKTVAASLGFETIDASDGVEALEMLPAVYSEISLILLDWNMPEMSGYDVLLQIIENDLYSHIPVMMVTTEGQKSHIVAAIRAGAINYLTKPFTADELESKLVECLQIEGENV